MERVLPRPLDWRWLIGVGAWATIITITALSILRDAIHPPFGHLYDWHVYAAGGIDLADRTLYRVPLEGWTFPVEHFNQPPLAAWLAMVLLPFGAFAGGIVFQVINVTSLFLGAALGCRALGVSVGWGAATLLAYAAVVPAFYKSGVELANSSWIVMALVAGFCVAHLEGRHRTAGVLLGLAIALKLWPLLLLTVPVRASRWREVGATIVVLAGQGIAFLLWLGPDVIPHAVSAINERIAPELIGELFWISAMPRILPWWPAWGAVVVAAVLLAIPARERLSLGLALLAGLAIVANLWHHYLPTLALGVALTLRGAVDIMPVRRDSPFPARQTAPPATPRPTR